MTDHETAAPTIEDVRDVAREARALIGSDDEQRREAFLARKQALLDRLSRD